MTPARHEVLVVGESLIDVITRAGAEPHRAPGGSPMNVAIGLGRLDVPTTLLTRIGDDADGRAIAAHLRAAGVLLDPKSYSDASTGTAAATMDADGAATYVFDLSWDLPVEPVAQFPGWIHVGSIASFIEPGAEKVRRLLASAPAGSRTSYDPNIRAALIADHATSFVQFERVAELSDVVKMSDEDAEWLFGPASVDDVLDRIMACGPSIAVVTQGGDGATLATRSGRVHVDADRIDVVDTIGAGDSYMAALVWQLLVEPRLALDAGKLRAIGETAGRVAAITSTREGANPPTSRELWATPRS